MMNDWFSPRKEPATVLGMTLWFTLLAAFITVVGHLLIVPIVSLKVWAVITAAMLSPSVVIAIYQQIRLRRALSRKGRSGFGISN
jgi:hypothetical protein